MFKFSSEEWNIESLRSSEFVIPKLYRRVCDVQSRHGGVLMHVIDFCEIERAWQRLVERHISTVNKFLSN